MRATSIALFALGAVSGAFAAPANGTVTNGTALVTYSTAYDLGNTTLNTVACSNGANGLETKGYTNLSSLPLFPYIGGVNGIQWNSPLCGSCWKLTANGKSIVIQGVDASPGQGFNIAKQAFTDLAGSSGVSAGSVQVNFTEVRCPKHPGHPGSGPSGPSGPNGGHHHH